MRARSTGWLLVAGLVLATSCSATAGTPVAGGDATVTLTSVVPPSGTVPAPPLGSDNSSEPATTESTTDTSSPPRSSTPSSKPSTSRSSVATSDPSAGGSSESEPADVPEADPETPGPDSGPKCPADPQYVNEATTGLRADVAAGWRKAVAKAKAHGVTLCLNDGKRSRAQQQAQFDEYKEQYGEEVARQLVLPPDKSAHVRGDAVDAQPATGYKWLQATKGSLGFCRIYDNEAWHFEFAPVYKDQGCPARLPKPEA